MSRKIPNIDGSLPQNIKFIETEINLDSSLSDNEKNLSKIVIETIFKKINDYKDYNYKLSVKQIDLILGRIKSLLKDKLDFFTQNEKNNVNDRLNKNYVKKYSKKFGMNSIQTDLQIILIKKLLRVSTEQNLLNIKDFLKNEKRSKIRPWVIKNNKLEKKELKISLNETKKIFKKERNENKKRLKELNNTKYIIKRLKNEKRKKRLSKEHEEYLDVLSFINKEFKKCNNNIKKLLKKSFIFFEKGGKFKRLIDFILSRKRKNPKPLFKSITMLNLLNKTIESFLYLTKNIEEYWNKFKQNINDFLKKFEKIVMKFALRVRNSMNKVFPKLLIMWYGPPYFIGLIVLGIAATITGISYLITKYEPVLKWVANILLPFLASSIKIAAYFLKTVILVGNSILVFLKKFTMTVEFLWETIIKNSIKYIVLPLLRGAMSMFKRIEPWLELVWNDYILEWFGDGMLKFLGEFLTFSVTNIIKFFNTYVFTNEGGKFLDTLTDFIYMLEPNIKYITNVVFLYTYKVFKGLDKGIKIIFDFIKDTFISFFESIEYGLNKLKDFPKFIKDFKKNLVSLPNKIWNDIMEILPTNLVKALGAMFQFFGKSADVISKSLGKVWDNIVSFFGKNHEDKDIPTARKNRDWLINRWNELKPLRILDIDLNQINDLNKHTIRDCVKTLTNLYDFCKSVLYKINNLIEKLPEQFSNVLDVTDENISYENKDLELSIINGCKRKVEEIVNKKIEFENNLTELNLTASENADKTRKIASEETHRGGFMWKNVYKTWNPEDQTKVNEYMKKISKRDNKDFVDKDSFLEYIDKTLKLIDKRRISTKPVIGLY